MNADIPALLGMDVMDRESLTPCTVTNRLVKRVVDPQKPNGYLDQWHVPLARAKSRHLFAQMDCDTPVFITRVQLSRLHRQFSHPSADKLFKLLSRARPEDATAETKRILEEISKHCDVCQRIQPAPRRFRVAMGTENIRFNERILMDIMYLDGKPVLHIIDEGTHLNAAQFIPNKSTRTIWNTFLRCWCNIYVGLPNRILVDQGTEFSDSFVHLANEQSCIVEHTGVEAHSSLGLCEKYHQPIRTVYRKLRTAHPQMQKELALSLSVKGVNDVAGPDGITPSLLTFGSLPSMRTPHEDIKMKPDQATRQSLIHQATEEMEKIMAQNRINRAMKHSIPAASKEFFQPGDSVLIWRENVISSRIGEWLGPFTVTKSDMKRKLVWASDHSRKPFSITHVKHYHPPDQCAEMFFAKLHKSLSKFTSPNLSDDIYLTEILHPTDPRASSPEMTEAKKKEIKELLRRGTFKVILKQDVPPDGNVLPGRFVLSIKSKIDGRILFKARYVIGGHRDRMKDLLVHSTSTTQPQSVRLLLSIASILDLDVWGSDVKQAYLQARKKLERELYITDVVPEFELQPHECLLLLKPLYGLCDSGDLWYATMDEHFRNDLKLDQGKLDPALYALNPGENLKGLVATYVDDLLYAGRTEMRELTEKTKREFEMDKDEDLPLEFTGIFIRKGDDVPFTIDQKSYISKKPLPELTLTSTFKEFASARMRVAWLSHTRLDCLYDINQLAQVTAEVFNEYKSEVVEQYSKLVEMIRTEDLPIKVPKLNIETLRLIGFSDASFGSNRDLSSQLGYVVFLGDDSSNVVPIIFKSYKARRVTKSPMSAEVIAFADMFDAAVALKTELQWILGRTIPVQLFTDSLCLFKIISKGSRTSEKRTMIDVAAAREGFRDMHISDIGFVRGKDNCADGLTKKMSRKVLQDIMRTHKLEIKCEQWIIRK